MCRAIDKPQACLGSIDWMDFPLGSFDQSLIFRLGILCQDHYNSGAGHTLIFIIINTGLTGGTADSIQCMYTLDGRVQ